LKAGHLRLLEVVRHDVIDEFLRLVNHEASAVWLPRYHMTQAICLDLVKHIMQLDWEGCDDTTLGLVLDQCWVNDGVSRMIVVVMLDDETIVMG
jgi:hypothetical protein